MTESSGPYTCAVRVKGDSLRADHVCDGDYLIVRRGSPAQAGDVVLATTAVAGNTAARRGRIGRFYPAYHAEGVFLENVVTRHRDWFTSAEVQVEGVIAGVIRRFGAAEW